MNNNQLPEQNPNTQLPVEVVQEVSKESEVLFEDVMDSETITPIFQKLTAYATKLYQLQGENEKAKVLLKRAIIEDNMEATELSTDLRNAIKKFLYGE